MTALIQRHLSVVEPEAGSIVHASPPQDAIRRLSVNPDIVASVDEAARATQVEHSMGFVKSIKTYRMAVLWSVALSTAIVMEGFDLILLGSLYGFPSFQRKFGELQPDGQILGLFVNGIIADRYGYRKTMMGALCMIVGFIFIPFFAHNIQTLLVGQILLGIPFGCFQTLACTYASEISPTQLRAYMTTYVNLCWVIGQIIASGVLRGLVNRLDDWGYRIPFSLQWIWPIPICVAVLFAPESPWWLVRKGRMGDAKRSITRLTCKKMNPDFDVDQALSMITYTNSLEQAASAGTSYKDCFKGTYLRRTEIVCGVWAIQTLCGSSFMGFSSYFYQQAGLDVSSAFTMTLAQFCMGGVGTMCSWFLMGWFVRRTLYLSGQAAMTVMLALIGFTSFAGKENVASQWAIGSMLLVYTFIYDCTTKSVVLARNLYNITGICANVITPLMLNPTARNWGATSGFFWAVSCTLCFVWTYFRVPEPKGRTYGELDVLFEAKVPARKFKIAVVDGFIAARSENLGKTASDARDGKVDEKRLESV